MIERCDAGGDEADPDDPLPDEVANPNDAVKPWTR